MDISQNVDRLNNPKPGIVACITPSAKPFASNRHTVLIGEQLLRLQGIPEGLLLGNESQRQLQDLAGNAMSTTVIGASLISALVAGCRVLGKRPSEQPLFGSDLQQPTPGLGVHPGYVRSF